MSKLNIIRCILTLGASVSMVGNIWAQEPTIDKPEDGTESVVFRSGENSTSAISTVSGDELYKLQTANLSNTLVGVLPGLTVIQGSGEAGYDNASWLIRGVGSYGSGNFNSAKIFVDGFEVNANYMVTLSPSEIESVKILKDGAALTLLGERGANGAIWITTHRGVEGPAKVSAKVRYGVQNPTVINKPLDSYSFASLYNQAVSNDNAMTWSPFYSEAQLEAYRNGTAPNVDWYEQVLSNSGSYVDGDVIFNGGNKDARYNVNLGYLNQQGMLNTTNTDQTKNLGYERYNLRANLDFNMMKIFEVKVDLAGKIEMRNRPNYSISTLMNDLASYPSNIYNVYDDDAKTLYSGTAIYRNNPYGSITGLGWYSNKARVLQGNFSVKERLDFITPGLYLKEAFSFNSYTLSTYSKTKNYARYSGGSTTTTDETTTITASGYGSGGMDEWKQGQLTAGYDYASEKSSLSVALNMHLSAYNGDGYFSYKYHYLNYNGYVNYNYDNRYVAELGFSYFGNDSYAADNRWAFYPAISGAWIVSNEEFLKNNDVINHLKLRASAGMSGFSDSSATSALSNFSSNGRFLFKDYYTNSYVGSFYTGATSGNWQSTLVQMFIPNHDAHAERSTKYNVGFDATLLGNRLTVTADAFLDKRTDILTLDNSLMGYYGKNYSFSNIGRMTNKGFELSAAWNERFGDFAYQLNGMVSFNRNRIDYMAEVSPAHEYNAQTGRPYGTYIGLEAQGFYGIEDFDDNGRLLSSIATPAFGDVQPGDVRYADLDGNSVVDQNDVTAIGKSAYPEWTYSFGGNVSYKGFDLTVMFQGIAGSSINLLDNWYQTVAFVDNGNAYAMAQEAWAYYPTQGIDTRTTAKYPRLTTQSNENNYRTSSMWIKDRDFLKLRNLEIGYNIKLSNADTDILRIFVSGHNLFTISSLLRDYNMDPECIYGGYPAVKSYNIGLSITF